MTAKELIHFLSKLPPNAIVKLEHASNCGQPVCAVPVLDAAFVVYVTQRGEDVPMRSYHSGHGFDLEDLLAGLQTGEFYNPDVIIR